MSWKRYFTVASTNTRSGSLLGGRKVDPKNRNYSSYLPDVYTGHPNRADRLRQYENMDADSEVNAALDILAEFCSQTNSENGTPFRVFFKEQATNAEIRVIKTCLQQWTKLNKFHKRIFRIVRNVFKNGDAFFVRDPENFKWMYVDPSKVVQIVVNESEGKEPAQYFIRDWNPNFEALTTTALMPSNINGSGSQSNAPYTTTQAGGGGARGQAGTNYAAYNSSGRFQDGQQEYIIDAKHVIHLSMSDGLDTNFPFGTSILESIFKVYKQKELLEDAIIIYRVQRAPERRVFYIDVGGMPSHLAMSFVERIKNEVNQRRIPSAGGGAQSVIDAGYNPIGINDDYFFPQCLALDQQIKLLDGRDVTLQEVINEYNNGKENWVYAVNQETHLIEPGRIAWAGKTRLNAELMEVTLDNGAKINLTPDHRFIMRDGSEVEAKDLKAGDGVMSFNADYKVVSVVHLDCREDTGDITVESASGAHTFALTAGVFVHNSAEGRGSKVEILPGGCLEMDTRVWLTDGRILSIAQLTEEYAAGKENWTYSVNPENGNIVPGLISWAGVTQESAQVVKLTLDNGNTLTCTPDHKFPIPGKGLVRADQLAVGDNFVTYNPYNDAATAKLARIQKLTEPTQVGTLTIDVDEIHHGYHNFALEIGIFTQNSNLGEIDDLKFFTNKLFRALRIPSSYLPTGSDDGGSNFNDGRVGTAYIQELRFNEYCERLQSMMQEQFDTEFKMFLHSSGVNVDSNIFDVKFNPPQNFASYRQAQMDTDRVNTFNTMSQSPFVSKRFALRRFLNLSTEEVAENERLWREENINAGTKLNASAEMRSAGITAAGVGDDLSNFSDPNLPDELDQDQEGTTNNQQSTNTRNMGSTANTPQGNQTQSPG